jgi:hypothetical protein
MTGPEHYREAERLLTEAAAEGAEGTYFIRPESLAAAQVHATLALAAASAEQAAVTAFAHDINSVAIEEWADALGLKGGDA